MWIGAAQAKEWKKRREERECQRVVVFVEGVECWLVDSQEGKCEREKARERGESRAVGERTATGVASE